MTDTDKTSSPATTDDVTTVIQNPSNAEEVKTDSTDAKKASPKTTAKSTVKTTRKSSSTRASKSTKKVSAKSESKDSTPIKTNETPSDSNTQVKAIPEEKAIPDAQVPNQSQKDSATLKEKTEEPSAKPNASLKQGANTKNAQKQSKTTSNAKQNRQRNVTKMSNARFVDKVFQNSSEALSRALVRKEQKQLLDQVLDSDVPINHSHDAKAPTQVMKLPKVPPETRPGRAAMFGNVPLSPLQYEPRHKSEDFSKAYLREKVYLDTDQAQRLFENCYDDVDVSFSILATVLRRYDKDAFNRTEKTIINELTRIQEHFRKGLTNVASSLDECVKEENRRVAFHDHEREYVVPIHTPYSLRYITCVTLYDKYVSRLNAALITGIVDYDSFDSCLRAANTILQQFRHDAIIIRHRTLRDLRNHSGKRTEIKRAEQMAEKSAQEERMETTDHHPSKRTKS